MIERGCYALSSFLFFFLPESARGPRHLVTRPGPLPLPLPRKPRNTRPRAAVQWLGVMPREVPKSSASRATHYTHVYVADRAPPRPYNHTYMMCHHAGVEHGRAWDEHPDGRNTSNADDDMSGEQPRMTMGKHHTRHAFPRNAHTARTRPRDPRGAHPAIPSLRWLRIAGLEMCCAAREIVGDQARQSAHAHAHARSHAHTHTHTHPHARTHHGRNTRTRKRARTRTRTRTRTCTRMRTCIVFPLPFFRHRVGDRHRAMDHVALAAAKDRKRKRARSSHKVPPRADTGRTINITQCAHAHSFTYT